MALAEQTSLNFSEMACAWGRRAGHMSLVVSVTAEQRISMFSGCNPEGSVHMYPGGKVCEISRNTCIYVCMYVEYLYTVHLVFAMLFYLDSMHSTCTIMYMCM